jgi:acetyl-CoA/propionyl-CoA carboxylase carboxyl transferase subunit
MTQAVNGSTSTLHDARDPQFRLEQLFDRGSTSLLTPRDSSGVLTMTGLVDGVRTIAFCSDPAVQGGAMGRAGCSAIVAAYEKALADEIPIVGLWHSGGARLQEGVHSLHAVGLVFAAMTRASGRIPQISVVLGPAAGGAAYGPALTDVVIMAPAGRVFVTGPDVVRSVTGEDVDAESLGGPAAHDRRSGVAHVLADDEADAFVLARRLVGLFANQGMADVGAVADRDLRALLPESARRAYDVQPVVDSLLDEPGVRLQAGWAPNITTTFGRIGGRTVGVVANNPMRLGGCLNSDAAEKAARFVRLCDAFGIPLVALVDVPGYLPGTSQEWGGVVRRGAKLLHAFAEARVPRITVISRKAYGGAFIAMNARCLGATRVMAWPEAEVAVMGAVAAVRILHRRQLAAVAAEARPALELELAAEHDRVSGGLRAAVAAGVVDEVVSPEHTRSAVAAALATAAPLRGFHGNIPL